MKTVFKALNDPPKQQSFSIENPLHGLTKFNTISYLLMKLHFWSPRTCSVCMMEENRLLHCSTLKLCVISLLICPTNDSPSVQHSVEGTEYLQGFR